MSKAEQLKIRALKAGFQPFEADAFKHCLARFEHAVRAEYEVVAWMDADEHIVSDTHKKDPKHHRLSIKAIPFSGYDTPLYKKKEAHERTI